MRVLRSAFVISIIVGGGLAVGCGNVSVSSDAKPGGGDGPSPNAPVLTSISPARGIVTTQVTFTGSKFGATQSGGSVSFGGQNGTVVSWSDTSIVASVPSIFPGDADVKVTTSAGTSAAQTFRVVLPPMVYVHNDANESNGFDSVTAMTFNPSTGALNAVSGPISMGDTDSSYGGCSQSIWVNEKTRRLFVTGTTGVAVFDIDPVNGGLTKVPGSPFVTGADRAFGVVTNDAGTRVFAVSYNHAANDGMSNVAVFDVGTNGALTAVTGSPFLLGAAADTIELNGAGTVLVANTFGGDFNAWAVSSAGAISAITGNTAVTAAAPGFNRRPGTDQFFFPSSGKLGAWTLSAGGMPTAITGSPFTFTNAGGTPDTPTFPSDGSRIYFGSWSAGFLYGFNLDAAGTPTAIAGSPWSETGATSLSCTAISQDGAHLIAADENSTGVLSLSVDASGVPTQVNGSPFANPSTVANASGLAITF